MKFDDIPNSDRKIIESGHYIFDKNIRNLVRDSLAENEDWESARSRIFFGIMEMKVELNNALKVFCSVESGRRTYLTIEERWAALKKGEA